MCQCLRDDTKYQHFLFNPFKTKLYNMKIVFGCDGLNALPTFCSAFYNVKLLPGNFLAHIKIYYGENIPFQN